MKKIWNIFIPACLLSFVLTLQLPVEMYFNNADEFMIPLKSLMFTWGSAFVILLSVCMIPVLVPDVRFQERYQAVLSILALLIWFTSHFMFGSYGAFDGRGLNIDPFSIKGWIEAITWLLMLLGAYVFAQKMNKYLFQATTGLLLTVIALTGYHLYQGIHISHQLTNVASEHHEYMPDYFVTFSSKQNIIHIVLDEQQSTVTDYLIQHDPRFQEKMTGFTFYPNTAANYRSTAMAIPAMLTGKVYKNDSDKNVFLNNALSHNAFTSAMESVGFDTSIYTMGFYCNKATIKHCIPQPELSPDKSAYLLLDFSLFKAVPDMLKPEIYNDDGWVIRKHFVNPSYEASLGGLNHLAFQYFTDHMRVADTAPTYKFYHSMITHSPAVLLKDCNLRVRRVERHGMEGKAQQAGCAFNHVFALVDKLKEEGIYDNTMIIISSDHGANYLPDTEKQSVDAALVDERHYTTSLATLLIKPFKATAALKTSDAPASLNDIPNTVLAELALPRIENGENILALNQDQNRTREFIFYDYTGTYWNDNKLPPLTIYKIQGDVRDVRNWTLACADLGAEKCEKH